MNKEQKEKDNLYRHVKNIVESMKREKVNCKRRLDEIERTEREILLILASPEIAKQILKVGDSNE